MEERIQKLEREVEALKERNRRVEADKAWETSNFRVLLIAAITYVVAAIVLYAVEVEQYLATALVPTMGYVLSTLSLPSIKRWWVSERSR